MVELFSLIKRNNSIKIKCDNLSYWRTTRPTDLINYLSDNLDNFNVEKFYVEEGRVFEDIYVKAFDIELYMDDNIYKQIMNKFKSSGRYEIYENWISLKDGDSEALEKLEN